MWRRTTSGSVSESDAGRVPELDAAAVVRVLNTHGVEFVVIGGMAAHLNDLPVPATVDIDITPSRQQANLERLAKAFDELEAGLYSANDSATWFPRVPVENWAQYDNLHLMTGGGQFAPGVRGGLRVVSSPLRWISRSTPAT